MGSNSTFIRGKFQMGICMCVFIRSQFIVVDDMQSVEYVAAGPT